VAVAVLCDFDGTIVNIDTCVYILEKFAAEDWRVYDRQFERGELTLEECLQKQFSTVFVPKATILDEIEQELSIRSGFAELVEFCEASKVPLIIVSAGLDVVIAHFLESKGWTNLVQVYAPESKCTANGIKIAAPKCFYSDSINFKDDLVSHYKKRGKKVIYIGDGMADFYAAKKANFPFAIKTSKLAAQLRNQNIPYTEIVGFQKVIETIIHLINENEE
jgi:2-hydroxy-3-keto-5-methylthiopentenyl-1-phosphate phosphatase